MQEQKLKGILCIIGSAFFFSLLNVFIKAAGDIPVMQKSIFRNLIALLISCCVLRKRKIHLRVDRECILPMIGRAVFGTAAALINFFAADRILLADVAIISKLTPFAVILLSAIILKERVSMQQMLCLLCAFGGCILIVQPEPGSRVAVPYVIALAGSICAGVAYTCLRYMGKRRVEKDLIVFYFSLTSTLIVLPLSVVNYCPMSLKQIITLLGVGVCATAGQYAVTAAYSYAPAKELSIYDFSGLLFSGLFGLIIYQQKPNSMSLAGYAVVFLAALVMFLREQNLSKEKINHEGER